jgi:hypothetical protein
MAFEKATRKRVKALIGLMGHSGSGKTFSALELSTGLAGPGGKIGFIDTESGRGSMYAGTFEYDVKEIHPAFTPEKYIEAINASAEARHDVLIIDSFTHCYSGQGGILDAAEAGGKKGLAKWLEPKLRWKRLVNTLLQNHSGHVIVCTRVKDIMEEIEVGGKKVYKATGAKPDVEKNFIFEMTANILLNQDNSFAMVKCPDGLRPAFATGKLLNRSMGTGILNWINGGAPPKPSEELDALKRAAEESVSFGVQTYQAFWASLTPAKKTMLKDLHAGYKADAAKADERAKLAEQDQEDNQSGAYNETPVGGEGTMAAWNTTQDASKL